MSGDDPVTGLRGKYAGRGPDTDRMRRAERVAQAELEEAYRSAYEIPEVDDAWGNLDAWHEAAAAARRTSFDP